MLNLYTPRKLWLFPGCILFYMYLMLIVTSKILMHIIKPLKNPITDKNVFIYFYPKMLLKSVQLSLFFKIKLFN